MDHNRNGYLEPQEDVGLFSRWWQLRRCIPQFLNSCDANLDRQVSPIEWMDCFGFSSKCVARNDEYGCFSPALLSAATIAAKKNVCFPCSVIFLNISELLVGLRGDDDWFLKKIIAQTMRRASAIFWVKIESCYKSCDYKFQRNL